MLKIVIHIKNSCNDDFCIMYNNIYLHSQFVFPVPICSYEGRILEEVETKS